MLEDYPLNIKRLKGLQTPNEDSIWLYHVFDESCQTPFVPGQGISAGRQLSPPMPPYRTIPVSALGIYKHLNWHNRDPTPYISLWDDRDTAVKEAKRRATKKRGKVGIVIVDLRQLIKEEALVFRPFRAIKDSFFHPDSAIKSKARRMWEHVPLSRKEWLVFGHISDEACLSVEWFAPPKPGETVKICPDCGAHLKICVSCGGIIHPDPSYH